ncbi:glycerophosphodiester phosphodiesterase [Sphingomonas aracearum]|uniref:glycerophosphodiester phosphodiesterase n=1 Tax=Sphingomonas aracearum TaxID=2283317 RepID=A0A369VW50_9SPHN|nr:glycerophosphodiester phosphodiesterase [Sphingomonas aracearum]RDE05400.1 glycerophosphodiester phosphodiesterase [Sphingomonas aracearum]
MPEPLSAPPLSPALSKPVLIAHRGASGYRPEHTLAAYELAIEQGADFIEPDVVPTKDGHLVARHENDITETTDVADHPEFAARKTTKTIDGEQHSGWFTEDFTLAELKTLRARERLPMLRPDNRHHDGQFAIPTFAEVIALAKKHGVGVYPETKHPTYFASIGLPTDDRLVAELQAAGWNSAGAPVFIQSFEVKNLQHLHRITKVRLIQLMDAKGAPADGAAESYAGMATPAGLREIARYAWGIGPNKDMIRAAEPSPAPLIADAHRAGLRVHPWTFRAENFFLPKHLWSGMDPRAHGRLSDEIAAYLKAGVDGFFTDFPDIGVAARNAE